MQIFFFLRTMLPFRIGKCFHCPSAKRLFQFLFIKLTLRRRSLSFLTYFCGWLSLYDLANIVPTLAKFYHQASEAYEQACTRHISMIIYIVSEFSPIFHLFLSCSGTHSLGPNSLTHFFFSWKAIWTPFPVCSKDWGFDVHRCTWRG